MASCKEMKEGQIYECKECGLQLQVVNECKMCGGPYRWRDHVRRKEESLRNVQ